MVRSVMAEYVMTCRVPGRLLVHWSSYSARGDPGLGLRHSQNTSTLPQSLTHGKLKGSRHRRTARTRKDGFDYSDPNSLQSAGLC